MTLNFIKRIASAPARSPSRFNELEKSFTARQVIAEKVFPGVSESTLLRHAKKHGIGKKFGRQILFSRSDVKTLYEVLPQQFSF
jgi:hypothetical protein